MAQTLAHPPFSSAIDPTFWAELAELKMTKLKLDSRPHPLHASYSSAAATAHRADGESGADAAAAAWMNLAGNAFAERPVIPPRAARASGRVVVVNTLEGLVEDPHLEAVDFWQTVDHPTEGKLRMTRFPVNFSETPADVRHLPPRLGEDSVEILREAGISEEQIEAMLEAGTTRAAG